MKIFLVSILVALARASAAHADGSSGDACRILDATLRADYLSTGAQQASAAWVARRDRLTHIAHDIAQGLSALRAGLSHEERVLFAAYARGEYGNVQNLQPRLRRLFDRVRGAYDQEDCARWSDDGSRRIEDSPIPPHCHASDGASNVMTSPDEEGAFYVDWYAAHSRSMSFFDVGDIRICARDLPRASFFDPSTVIAPREGGLGAALFWNHDTQLRGDAQLCATVGLSDNGKVGLGLLGLESSAAVTGAAIAERLMPVRPFSIEEYVASHLPADCPGHLMTQAGPAIAAASVEEQPALRSLPVIDPAGELAPFLARAHDRLVQ